MLKVKQDSDCVRFFWGRAFELIVRDTNSVLEVQPEVGLSTIIPLNDLQAIWLDIKKEDVGTRAWTYWLLPRFVRMIPGLVNLLPGTTYRVFFGDLVLHTSSGQYRLKIASTENKHDDQRLVSELASYTGCEVAPFSKQSAMNAEFNFQYTYLG
jgi:hypothetical protein